MRTTNVLTELCVSVTERGRVDPVVARIVIWTSLGLPLLVVAAALSQPWVDPALMFRDPLAAAATVAREQLPPGMRIDCCSASLGAVSNLGIILWSLPLGALGLVGLVILRRCMQPRQRSIGLFALTAAAFTAILATDDVFMIHETLGTKIPRGEFLFFAVYAAFPLLYATAFRDIVFTAYAPILFFSLAMLSGSIVIDVVMGQGPVSVIAEDAMKLMGISAWCGFHLIKCYQFLDEEFAARDRVAARASAKPSPAPKNGPRSSARAT